MSVERLQTVLQLSATGADQVIGELNRVLGALNHLGEAGKTPLSLLSQDTIRSVESQRPQAGSKLQELQAKQELAQRRLTAAIEAEARVKADTGSSAEKVDRAEQATIRAAVAESSARRALTDEIYKLLPEVQERVRQEKLGAQMARDYVAAKKREAEEARKAAEAQERARQSLDRQRNAAYSQQYQAQIDQALRDRVRVEREMAAIRERELAVMRREAEEAFLQLPSENALARDELDRMLAKPDRQPGDTDKVYRAREVLADATIAEGVAHSRLAEAVRKAELGEGASRQQLRDAVDRARIATDTATRTRQDAERKLDVAIQNEALARAQNTRRTFREDFLTGFRGRRGDSTMAEQIGQAFKFSVFYGTAYKALFGLTQTLQATLQEGIQFQQAMTDLSIAASRPKEELDHIADQLGKSATRAGFAPSQGIEIGARSLGLYGVTDSDAAVQDRVMRISARVVNQLAVGSKMQPVDLQGNIAAIAQALGTGAAGQFTIADLDAYMTKKFGVQQGSTLESLAQSASVGKAAGFTNEQLFAIAADMISRTGQTPSAVGGYMAQIFSRGGEGSLVDVASKQGIDASQPLAQIVEQLAQIYKDASSQERAQISAAFGRGKIQNAAVAVLSDYAEVQKRAGLARGGAASGQADEQFNTRMNDIGGQIAQLSGVLKDFADQLGHSGVLDLLGVTMVAFRELVEAATGLLRVWNELPSAVKDTIIALGLLKVALKASAELGLASKLVQRAGLKAGFSPTALPVFGRMEGPTLPGTTWRDPYGRYYVHDGGIKTSTGIVPQGTRVLATAEGEIIPAASRAGIKGFAKAGAVALGLVDPMLWAVGGLMAIGALKNTADDLAAAQHDATQALLQPSVGPGSSSAEFSAYASELKSLAAQSRDVPGWFKVVTLGQGDNQAQATATRLDAEAKRIQAVADRLATQEQFSSTPTNSSVFKSTSADDITAGLEALKTGGATAGEQMKALRDILFGTADAAKAAAAAFDAGDFAAQSAGDVRGAAAGALKGFKFTYFDPSGGKYTSPTRIGKGADLKDDLAKYLTGPETEKKLKEALGAAGVESLSDLDQSTSGKVAAQVGKGIAAKILAPFDNVEGGAVSKLQKRINKSIADWLLTQGTQTTNLLKGDSPLSRDDATAAANAAAQLSDQRLNLLPQNDSAGRIAELKKRIATLQGIQGRASEPIGVIFELVDAARSQIAEQQINHLERLRKIAQQHAKSKKEIAEKGKAFAEREIRAAIRAGDSDLLEQVLANAGDWAKDIAQRILDKALRVIHQAAATAEELMNVGNYIDGEIRGAAAAFRERGDAQDQLDENRKKRRRRKKHLDHIQNTIDDTLSAVGNADVFTTGSDSGNPLLDDGSSGSSAADKPTAAEIAAAKAAAYATRSGGQLAAAQAAIQGARAQLAKAKKGTLDYWQAMDSLFQAQNQYVEAVRAYTHNKALLRIDTTNPLAMARLAVREAARKLRQDQKRDKDPDVIAQDKADLQAQQASAEATAFSQRLQNVQTAEELGRISHQKYMRYLQHEHDRLSAIRHRTYQQQQELDQIDGLMKEAAKEMQGQWNFGDIKLPTPYQVRRYIEEHSGAKQARAVAGYGAVLGAAGPSITTTTITNNIYGDEKKFRRIIEEYVGKPTRTRTSSPRRR